MSGFLKKDKAPKESPASVLAAKYSALCADSSVVSVTDFQKLLAKNKYADIDTVLSWLSKQSEGIRCKPSGWFRYRYRWLRLEAANDLAGYKVGDVSKLREEIEAIADPIPDEFIQHAWDTYADFLAWIRTEPEAAEIYMQLDPSRDFTVRWFARLVPKYSNKYRRFSVAHEKFRSYLYRIADTCSSRKTIEKLLKEYGNGPKRGTEG